MQPDNSDESVESNERVATQPPTGYGFVPSGASGGGSRWSTPLARGSTGCAQPRSPSTEQRSGVSNSLDATAAENLSKKKTSEKWSLGCLPARSAGVRWPN